MPQHNLVAVIGLAILNGMFSPAIIPVFALHGLWYPFFLPAILPAIFLACSLIVSTFTLMLGGVPAALYERLSGGRKIFGCFWPDLARGRCHTDSSGFAEYSECPWAWCKLTGICFHGCNQARRFCIRKPGLRFLRPGNSLRHAGLCL